MSTDVKALNHDSLPLNTDKSILQICLLAFNSIFIQVQLRARKLIILPICTSEVNNLTAYY